MGELLAALLEAGDALFVIDQSYRILAWNRAAQTLLGLSPRQATGRYCFELLRGADTNGRRICAHPCEPMRALARGEAPSCFSLQVDRDSGARRPVEVSLLPLPAGLVAHLVRDATRQASLERFVGQVQSALDWLSEPGTPLPEVLEPTRPSLTTRERQILSLLADGHSTKSIASDMVLSQATIRKHIQHLLTKLGARHRLEAVATARRLGILR